MSAELPAILPLGEAALTIRLAETASVEASERAAALASAIRREAIDGVTDVVPSVASVSVYYQLQTENGRRKTANGKRTANGEIREALDSIVASESWRHGAPENYTTHTIPTRYDGADLDEVAERVGLVREEVIRRHAAREYHVLAIGFLPGWGYLGPLDPSLALPRRASPRVRIPAGSVAIAGVQTGIYPRVSPGGWNLIGSTGVVLFDARRDRPTLFRAGDRVRFEPIV